MRSQLSLVIPLHNEAPNVVPVVMQAAAVLASTGRTFEIILVDDGSRDATAAEASRACGLCKECRVLTLPERRGQAQALIEGLHAASGDLILTMDGDGQNDPGDLPQLITLAETGGYDLVCGWRVERNDRPVRRLMSRVANVVRRAVLGDGIHDAGCQLRVMRPAVVQALRPFEMLQAFLPAFAAAAGLRIAEVPVRHHPRLGGSSKYGLGVLWWRPALAMLRLRLHLWTKG